MNIAEIMNAVIAMQSNLAVMAKAIEAMQNVAVETPKAPAKARKTSKAVVASKADRIALAKAIKADGRPSVKAFKGALYLEKDGNVYRRFGGRVYRTVIDPAEAKSGKVSSCYGLLFQQVDGSLNLVAVNPSTALIAKLTKEAKARKGSLYADMRGMPDRISKFVKLA